MTFPISPRNYEFYILLQFSTTELEHISLEEGHLRVIQRQLLKLNGCLGTHRQCFSRNLKIIQKLNV